MSIKRQKSIFIGVGITYVIASAMWIIYLFFIQNESQKAFDLQLSEVKNMRDSIQKRESFLQEFLVVDNKYILGKYDEAISAFEAIEKSNLNTPFEKDLIGLRLKRINEILNNLDTLSADIEAYQFSLNNAKDEIDALRNEKDSLLFIEKERQEELNEQIAALKEDISKKSEALNRKEKVKVISFRNEKGNLIHYLGEISEGKANGGGVGIWDTGGLYKGNWKDNLRHGEGVYTWKDGHKYEGNFVEGVREGQGTYYWSSGEKYVGEWKNNMRNGQGTLYDRDNNISYEGKWQDDKVQK
jgi:hypothetical protein